MNSDSWSFADADPQIPLPPALQGDVVKHVDDVSTPPPSGSRLRPGRAESSTLTTLSRLFAVQATSSPDSPPPPPPPPPSQLPYASSYTRSMYGDRAAALPDHLYRRGLLAGKHSDITVHAFGHDYRLHRLILDRAPFFASALSEPWLEASAKSMTVHPEDIDPSISQTAFELALKRLYGCRNGAEEEHDPVGLFCVGCWLEMDDLVDSAIESMLRQMTTETLSPLIKLVTSNYYGRAGDKVLASAKSMLCRDGWQMPLRFWDGIPGDITREIVGGDGFFIDGEFDRWVLSKRLLDRRLRQQAVAVGLLDPADRRKVLKVPESAGLMAVRFDGVYRRSDSGSGRGISDHLQKWISLYTHPDVEPLLVLLDEGVHYVHLDFEQLQYIRGAKDCLGLPLNEKVISTALWQQMELRQKVMNARDVDLDLGLSVACTDDALRGATRETTMSIHASSGTERSRGKCKATEPEEHTPPDDDIDSGSWDGNGRPRKFWIPASDCNIVMGGNAEPIVATSHNTATLQRHASRLSATLQAEDVQWATDFAALTSQPRPPLPLDTSGVQPAPTTVSYTHFPPFRFSAEFPNPRLLKDKKRVYSRTVFYAGSLWNIYIQKVASSRSKQLGVYLHRAKERETEEVLAGTAGLAQGGVDERIGQLEREIILRSERRERRQRARTRTSVVASDGVNGEDFDSSGSAGVDDANAAAGPSTARARNLLTDYSRSRKRSQTDTLLDSISPPATSGHDSSQSHQQPLPPHEDDDDDNDDDDANDNNDSDSDSDSDFDPLNITTTTTSSSCFSATTATASPSHRGVHVPTLPPYIDARPTIRTYFKIYSPSRRGRMLSVYESAPDRFNFSQSWGWKSSSLMMLDEEEEEQLDHHHNQHQNQHQNQHHVDLNNNSTHNSNSNNDEGEEEEEQGGGERNLRGGMDHQGGGGERERRERLEMKGKGDGKLRFMVVIGNV